jgi:hypothetical protein
MNAIIAYILEKSPIIATLLLLIAAVTFIVWTVSKFYHRVRDVEKAVGSLEKSVDTRFTSLEKSVDDLRMGLLKFEHMVELGFANMKVLEDKIPPIENKLNFVCAWIMGKDASAIEPLTLGGSHPNYSVAHSPRTVNERGLQLYEQSGAKTVLEKNIERYLAQLATYNSPSAFDAEDNAYTVIYLNSSSKDFLPIKHYLFNNAEFDGKPADMRSICFVMSIPLRDEYLKRHPELLELPTISA